MKKNVCYIIAIALFVCTLSHSASAKMYGNPSPSQLSCLPMSWTGLTSLSFDGNGDAFVTTSSSQILRSTDNGTTWYLLDTIPQCNNYMFGYYSIAAAPNGTLYLLGSGYLLSSGCGLLRSIDGGISWQPDTTFPTLTYSCNLPSAYLEIDNHGNLYDVWHSNDPTTGISLSTDGGGSWSTIWSGIDSGYSYNTPYNSGPALTIDSSGDLYMYWNGFFRSTDQGNTWLPMLEDTSAGAAASIVVADGSQYLYAVADTLGIYRSNNHGASWSFHQFAQPMTMQQLATAPNGDVYSLVMADSFYYYGYYYSKGNVYRSTDHGETWNACDNNFGNDSSVGFVQISPNGALYAYTAEGNLFCSQDNGQSWQNANGRHFTSNVLPTCEVTSLVADTVCNRFAGTLLDGVFRSQDSGATWQQVDNGLTDSNIITLGVSRAGNIFAGTSGWIFRSTDEGNSWAAAASIVDSFYDGCSGRYLQVGENPQVTSFLFGSTGEIFAGTVNYGLFRSRDEGNSWQAVPFYDTAIQHPAAPSITCITYGSTGDIYAGSWEGFIFHSTN
ncbi:MAG TPA: YCF48-related protein, partial [Candidatus Kapabacteria bacterium]|nr:YCF48-related protein [Candidatus Kapabacteria bacterium]